MQITAFRIINAGNLKAAASVMVGKTLVHDFQVVQQPGQKPYVSPPKKEWMDASGKKQYGKPLIEFPDPIFQELQTLVLARYQEEAPGV